MQIHFEPIPAPMVVAIVATVAWSIAAMVLGLPLIRAWTRRMERRGESQQVSPQMDDRLLRIEQAVEAIAIEVERISEGQRYLAKLQAEQLPSPDRPPPQQH